MRPDGGLADDELDPDGGGRDHQGIFSNQLCSFRLTAGSVTRYLSLLEVKIIVSVGDDSMFL